MSTPDTSGEPNLFAFLTSKPAVLALFGQQIFHKRAKANVHGLYAVYQRADAQRQPMFCQTDGTVAAGYQIDIYSLDDVQCINGAGAIRRALVDYSGPMGAVAVKKVLLENDFDSVDPDPGLERRTQLYTVWYAEG